MQAAYGGTARPTYTQSRKQRINAAGGGIMGSNAGSMLVAPTADGSRPGYGWLEDAWDTVKDVGAKLSPFVEPVVDWFTKDKSPPDQPTGMPQGSPGQLNPYTPPYFPESTVAGPFEYLKQTTFPNYPDPIQTGGQGTQYDPTHPERSDVLSVPKSQPAYEDDPGFWTKLGQTIWPGGETGFIDLYGGGADPSDPTKAGGGTSIARQIANIGVPLGIGKLIHDYQRDYLARQPKFPMDETGFDVGATQRLARITPEAEAAAKGLFFTPQDKYRLRSPTQEQAILGAAEGGRIGAFNGGIQGLMPRRGRVMYPGGYAGKTNFQTWLKNNNYKIKSLMQPGELALARAEFLKEYGADKAQGGRIGYNIGQLVKPGAGRPGYGGGDRGWKAQMRADEMAADLGYESYYDMPRNLRDKVYKAALLEIDDALADIADMRRKNEAQGGRIGYDSGGIGTLGYEDLSTWDKYAPTWLGGTQSDVVKAYKKANSLMEKIEQLKEKGDSTAQFSASIYDPHRSSSDLVTAKEMLKDLEGQLEGTLGTIDMWESHQSKAQGGRARAQEGGLMDLGGMEKDYRQEGGFVPIGGQEKADDVPARLSKNEFVFTADAVRAAGGGDIDAGAEIMENLMENLEAGGKVSEKSQGLEGARNMFANTQQLEKRII